MERWGHAEWTMDSIPDDVVQIVVLPALIAIREKRGYDPVI